MAQRKGSNRDGSEQRWDGAKDGKVNGRRRPFWLIDRDITNAMVQPTEHQPEADLYSPVANLAPDDGKPKNTDPWKDVDDPEPRAGQLREAIDSGETRDKVDFPDPAAAPLGTDAEAGGRPPSREEIELAMRHETHRTGRNPAASEREIGGSQASSKLDRRAAGLLMLTGLLVLVLVLLGLIFLAPALGGA